MRIDEVRHTWGSAFDGNIALLDQFELACDNFINNKIDIEDFVKGITPLDEWAFRLYWGAPQKTNWMNTGQNKNYPILKETIWTAIFERIRQEVFKRTNVEYTLIQGKRGGQVAVAVFEDGKIKTKDVDTGLALQHNDGFLVPVIAAECKGGHACSTCHDGIWGQGVRMKRQFPNAIQAFVTDNNVTVGLKTDVSTYSDGIDFTFCERGENNSEAWVVKDKTRTVYNRLNPRTMQTAIDIFTEIVSSHTVDYWLTMNEKYPISGEAYREMLDNSGCFVAPKFRKYLDSISS